MSTKSKSKLISMALCLAMALFATSATAQFFGDKKKDETKKQNTEKKAKAKPKPAVKKAKPVAKNAKPAGKKAKPVAKKAKPASKKGAPQAASSDVTALLKEIKEGQAALQAEVAKLEKSRSDESEATLTKEQEADKAKLETELTEVQTQIESLEKAVAGGLDPAVVQDSKTSLEAKAESLRGAIAAIVPAQETNDEGSDSQALVAAVEELKAATAALGTAADKEDEAEPEEAAEEDDGIGVSIEFGLASAYVFRGLNVFMSGSQQDQHALFAPGLSWAIGETGLSVGYWSAYQINGGNQEEMVAVALGHEQDLYASWETGIGEKGSLSLGLCYYFYPFADKDDAGATNPSFLEPAVGIAYSGGVDLGFDIAYFGGLQKEIRDLSYLYLHAGISKGFELNSVLETSVGLGFGYKIFKEGAGSMSDNMFDLGLDWDLGIQVSDSFSVSPGVHIAWTNLEDVDMEPDDGSEPYTDEMRMGEEYVVFFSLTSAWEM
ncbi:MAG: hypothetical protein GY854_14440 [Deltaproteobacteria bacterium]|nr:hypothetical protein [Deltaproteobacteria bacterium]